MKPPAWQFVIVKRKQIDVSFSCIRLVTDHEFRHVVKAGVRTTAAVLLLGCDHEFCHNIS